jgi:hypothetical protein
MEYQAVTFEDELVLTPISPYQYVPLNQQKNEFRLVELQQSQSVNDTLVARLRHYSFQDPPPYLALSYHKGDPRSFVIILLDGIEVPISLNLEKALRQLRPSKYHLIWADSLCIDQQEENEKAAQILRIRVIYREAQLVAAWLGIERDGSDQVMRLLGSILSVHSGRGKSVSTLIKPMIQSSMKHPLQMFFYRSFWIRLWIIQEVVLASRVSIFCGRYMADWDSLDLLVASIRSKSWSHELPLEPVERLCYARQQRIEGKSTSLLDALYHSSLAVTSNRLDKVYALLGLSYDYLNYISEPKYGWSPQELCLGMTRTVVMSRRSLDIIFAGPNRDRKAAYELPSWCPDYLHFISPPVMRHLAQYLSGEYGQYRLGQYCNQWRSTFGSAATRESFSIDNGVLQAKGHHLATIESLAQVLGEPPLPQQHHPDPGFWQCLMEHGQFRKENGDIFEALSRMLFLLYNKDYLKHIEEPHLLHILFEFDSKSHSDDYKHEHLKEYATVKEWRNLNRNFWIRGKTLERRCTGSNAQRLKPSDPKPIMIQPYQSPYMKERSLVPPMATVKMPPRTRPLIDIAGALNALTEIIENGMRLMTTAENQIGWAHPDARVGDKIFLLEGCTMPVILRHPKHNMDKFEVVGHAIVDKAMDGSLWSDLDGRELRDIRIR